MKAIISDKYGQPDVLEFRELQKPTLRDDAVLVRVWAASVNAYDWHLLTADMFLVRLMGGGLLKPKDRIPGADGVGLVEVVGKDVTQFRAGDTWRYFLIGLIFNAARFLLLGLTTGHLYKRLYASV